MNLMDKYQKKAVKIHAESQGKVVGPWTPPPCGYLIIYSHIPDDFLLVTDTENRAGALRAQGIEDAINTVGDIEMLKELSPESLKAHQLIKKICPGSVIEKG
jgi:hypothetical protein